MGDGNAGRPRARVGWGRPKRCPQFFHCYVIRDALGLPLVEAALQAAVKLHDGWAAAAGLAPWASLAFSEPILVHLVVAREYILRVSGGTPVREGDLHMFGLRCPVERSPTEEARAASPFFHREYMLDESLVNFCGDGLLSGLPLVANALLQDFRAGHIHSV